MSKPEWTVTVVDRGRPTLILRARNRVTGKLKEMASGSTKRAAAEREAGAWAKELNTTGLAEMSRLDKAVERFEEEYTCRRRKATETKYRTILKAFKGIVGNPGLRSINESMLADFSRQFGKGKSVASLASAIRHLRVFLRWCYRQKLLAVLPHVEMPPNPDKPGGRAITGEEFERMLEVVPKVRPKDAEGWRLLLRGLWCSGLRLSEALALTWGDDAPVAVVGIDSKQPMIRIEGGSQKGGKSTLTPAVPELVKLLRSLPHREGKVFPLAVAQRERASTVIGKIGQKANLTATAHDLRRSFATRWAKRLPAQALRQLMRHASITTTLKFYATDDCGLAELLKGQSGDFFGDKPDLATDNPTPETVENP